MYFNKVFQSSSRYGIPNFSIGTELRVGGASSPAQLGHIGFHQVAITNSINNLSNGSQIASKLVQEAHGINNNDILIFGDQISICCF